MSPGTDAARAYDTTAQFFLEIFPLWAKIMAAIKPFLFIRGLRMRGILLAFWLTVLMLVVSAPARTQEAKQEKESKKDESKKESAKADEKKASKELRVTFDVSEAPDLMEWAEKAKTLCETWHPKIEELLRTKDFTPPSEVKLYFKKDMKGVAFASGNKITISASYVTKNPKDFGMVAHELTHVIQQYRGAPKNSGWLVEGIADYVRHYAYEPDVKMRTINVNKAKYTDAYQTAAQFLRWVEKTYDKEIVFKLHRALREREYQVAMFERATGKNVDELWEEFIETLKKK
jgi:hypothetical protein